jgi:DNA-binding response OmpR family regulator
MSRVLVVEDETHLAQGLAYNLEAEGHSVEVVGDGESALDRLLKRKESFDAVVLDVMLPGKDGFQVATELRAAKNYVPVLILTARGRAEDVLKGFAQALRTRDSAGASGGAPATQPMDAGPARVRSAAGRC